MLYKKHLIPNTRSIKDTKSDPDLSSHSMSANSNDFFATAHSKTFLTNYLAFRVQ